MTAPATSTPVASSIPSSPGDALTSSTSGPRTERIRSTPATPSPSTPAARIAAAGGVAARLQTGLRENEWSVLFLMRIQF